MEKFRTLGKKVLLEEKYQEREYCTIPLFLYNKFIILSTKAFQLGCQPCLKLRVLPNILTSMLSSLKLLAECHHLVK